MKSSNSKGRKMAMKGSNSREGGPVRITSAEKYCVPISRSSLIIVNPDPRETAREAVKEAVENGKAIVAVIETSGIKGLPTAEKEVKKAGRQGHNISLIYGTRITVITEKTTDGDRKECSIIFIPANKQGYSNLCEIITLGYEGYYTDVLVN